MKFGIISDTHDHLGHIAKAVVEFQKHGVVHMPAKIKYKWQNTAGKSISATVTVDSIPN